MIEFKKAKKDKSYKFTHKTEKYCNNVWNTIPNGNRETIVMLEYKNADIELVIEHECYDEPPIYTYFFICLRTEEDGWGSDDFEGGGNANEFCNIHTWDELEEMMFNRLVDYCERRGREKYIL